MKIESAAGEFEFTVESLKVVDDQVVIIGQMGVWEAETSVTREEAWRLMRLIVKSTDVWRYALSLPFRSSRRAEEQNS